MTLRSELVKKECLDKSEIRMNTTLGRTGPLSHYIEDSSLCRARLLERKKGPKGLDARRKDMLNIQNLLDVTLRY
jgi:hypothetical protein